MDEIPTPPRTIEVDDWTHIRTNLIRADLENLLFDNPTLVGLLRCAPRWQCCALRQCAAVLLMPNMTAPLPPIPRCSLGTNFHPPRSRWMPR